MTLPLFSPSTLVETPEGPRRADHLRVAQEVWAWDTYGDRRVIREISEVFRVSVERAYRIEAGESEISAASSDLQLWNVTTRKWEPLSRIPRQNILVGADHGGSYAVARLHEVASLPLARPVSLVGFSVVGADGLFANGLIISAIRTGALVHPTGDYAAIEECAFDTPDAMEPIYTLVAPDDDSSAPGLHKERADK